MVKPFQILLLINAVIEKTSLLEVMIKRDVSFTKESLIKGKPPIIM